MMLSQKFSKHQFISATLAVVASVAAVAAFVYAATSIGTNISVDGNLTVSGTSATSTFSTGGLTVGASQFVVQQTSGNVGIGTVNPSTLLSLGAGVAAQKLLLFESGAARYGFGIQSGEFRHYIADSATNGFTFGTISAVDGSTWSEKVRITTGGNVGIGTTSPTGLLSVNPTSAIGTNPQFVVGSSTQTSFVITNSGNVGIGTMSPAYKLDVQTPSNESVPTVRIAQGSSGQTPTNVVGLFLEDDGSSNSFYVFQTVTVGGGKSFSITNAGNVGIGTTGPLSKLDVNGGVTIGSYAGANAAPSNSLIVSGNVGIGTTTPYSKFHVSQGASATTTVNFGEIGITSSKACFNTKNTAGVDISFYFNAANALVVESNLCR